MKKILSALLVTVLILSSVMTLGAMAADEIKIVIDGTPQTYDQMPVIVNDRTMVPLRGIFEALGARVNWIDATKTIIGTKGDKTITLQIDNTLANVAGKDVTLDVAPQIISSRTMVPVRFISESLGAEVGWDGDTRTVTITSPVDENADVNTSYTVLDWLTFKSDSKAYQNGFGTIKFEDDVLNVKCETLPDKDSRFNLTITYPLSSVINPGDVCLMSFKVKVNSGTGYVKPWVQDGASKKALFAETGVGSDWTECYLPFVGIADIKDAGIRFGGALQDISIKDFMIENFKQDKKLEDLPSTIKGENGVTATPSTPSAPSTEEPKTEAPATTPATTPDGGTIILDWSALAKNSKAYQNGFGTIKFENDVLNVNCETLPEKDSKFYLQITGPVTTEIKEGDVCLMSFKVKVNSGEGYVKPWVQDSTSKKALFAETKVGSDWTECYLPFTGIANIRDAGIRFGGKVQNISIKDFMIVNYKNTTTVDKLPSTIK